MGFQRRNAKTSRYKVSDKGYKAKKGTENILTETFTLTNHASKTISRDRFSNISSWIKKSM